MASEPRNLALILARQMASNLATAMAVVDAEGTLAFFNEAAGQVLGQPFSETGELTRDELLSRLVPEDLDGNIIPVEELPITVALVNREPAHRTVCITGLDGERRTLAVTAFPLFVQADEFVGAVTIFWEQNKE